MPDLCQRFFADLISYLMLPKPFDIDQARFLYKTEHTRPVAIQYIVQLQKYDVAVLPKFEITKDNKVN